MTSSKITRVVLDTNLFISSLLKFPSIPSQIVQLLREQKYLSTTSQEILLEVQEVLNRQDIMSLTGMSRKNVDSFMIDLKKFSVITPEILLVQVVKDDPKDNKFVSCAIEGNADFIVSGDNHLLNLKEYQGIKILTPKEFLEHLKSKPH